MVLPEGEVATEEEEGLVDLVEDEEEEGVDLEVLEEEDEEGEVATEEEVVEATGKIL